MEIFIGNCVVEYTEDLKAKNIRVIIMDRTSNDKITFVVGDPKEFVVRDRIKTLRRLKL